MKENKEVKLSFWAAHATTIVSVTLVLLLIGIIAVITTGAAGETRRLREQIEISAIMGDSISDAEADAVAAELRRAPYVNSCKLITREAAVKAWKADTGEDLEAIFGVNILSPEIAFTLKSQYAVQDSIRWIEKRVAAMPGVEEVAMPDSAMVESMNRNITTLSLVLGAIALVMLVISFVLINNTVHLAVYSRRFTIHTMQLVGATDGFIRRPFVLWNMLAGLLSGLLADALLAVGLVLAPQTPAAGTVQLLSWPEYGVVAVGLAVIGALICGLAASIATSRYLHKDYGQLFR